MKKLNRQELTTLSNKIMNEINAPIKEAKLNHNKKLEKEFKKDPRYKAWNKLTNYLDPNDCYNLRYVKNNLFSQFEKENQIKFCKEVTFTEIESELILAQIECENLNDLIEKVKSKFDI